MKRALLVGINAYAQSPLQGCLNDVANMAAFLGARGFDAANIRKLTDGAATKAAILDGLKWLTTGLVAGDSVVFHYSGHGSYVADSNGDEADARDEIICPVDVFSGKYITDDALHQFFTSLPAGVIVDVFLDSCHSGTGLRELVFTNIADPEENGVVGHRFLPPQAFGSSVKNHHSKKRQAMRNFVALPTNNACLWSGCRDNQTSADAYIGGKYNGAFTFCLMSALSALGPTATRQAIDAQVQKTLAARGFSQVCQLETDSATAAKNILA